MKSPVLSERSKYISYLEEKKKLKETENSKRKRNWLPKHTIKNFVENDLEKEIYISEKSGFKRDFSLFVRSNELQRSV